ncbi:uncharacterized protein SOCG_04760 [Schizosaccharomyces octosporus yFS286]|uniref:Uncharacterized protein n=1 Tax=Schizosaccharomyces octosporus (strain yFS286) TaxID=483514 RepID=S9PMF4_SCHOY|nr:uncharacterized protein SOCG_04760 [Schizosaccharomyces octosporus yFS286]EPX70446.1 hypothetical protein SOCG_04760 [Schizosaccharomyces octosporus yFS286]
MKNKYTPVSDSEESLKTLTDEKADTHSADGTPPPYSASNKFIDLEMADGSAQNSAQESANNTMSGPSEKNKFQCHFWRGIATTQLLLYHFVFLIIVFGYKVPLNTGAIYGLAGGSIGSIIIFVIVTLITYPGWFTQAGIAIKNVLSAMCISALYVCFLNVPGFAMYYTAKKIMQFEKINNRFFYVVCFVDFVLFLFISMNPIARERLRLLVINIGNDIGNGANAIGNGIGNGIRNVMNLAFGTNQGDEVPQNEEIELQPLAEQSGEV